jgi:hypothetical protein
LIAALAVPLWPGRQQSLSPPTPAATVCVEYTGIRPTRLDQHPELAYLPPPSLAPRLRFAGSVTMPAPGPRCPSPPAVGVWYTLGPEGTVAAQLTVSGPGYPKPRGVKTSSTVTVEQDGRHGLVAYRSGGAGPDRVRSTPFDWAWWQQDDGSTWFAQSYGLSESAFLSALGSVRVQRGRLETTGVPTGLTQAVPATTGTDGDVRARFNFGSDREMLILMVRQESGFDWQARPGTRAVSINGAPGWIWETPAGQRRSVQWQPAPGVVAALSGNVSNEQILRLARATTKIALDDPRLAPRP